VRDKRQLRREWGNCSSNLVYYLFLGLLPSFFLFSLSLMRTGWHFIFLNASYCWALFLLTISVFPFVAFLFHLSSPPNTSHVFSLSLSSLTLLMKIFCGFKRCSGGKRNRSGSCERLLALQGLEGERGGVKNKREICLLFV